MEAEKLTVLQDLIMEVIYVGTQYHGVYFRAGTLLVDYKDDKTATWLRKIAHKLERFYPLRKKGN